MRMFFWQGRGERSWNGIVIEKLKDACATNTQRSYLKNTCLDSEFNGNRCQYTFNAVSIFATSCADICGLYSLNILSWKYCFPWIGESNIKSVS